MKVDKSVDQLLLWSIVALFLVHKNVCVPVLAVYRIKIKKVFAQGQKEVF